LIRGLDVKESEDDSIEVTRDLEEEKYKEESCEG